MKNLVLPLLVLLLLAPIYLALGRSEAIGQLGTDGPAYLAMAEHYTRGGAVDPVHEFVAATSRFPPVYPLLLAVGGGATDLLRAHRLTALCLAAALLALYGFLRVHRMPAAIAAAGMLVFGLLPGSWLLQMIVQSEYLFLFWSLLALSLLELGVRRQRQDLILTAAVAVALAVLTRTIGVVLFVPLLLALVRQPGSTVWRALLIALLPIGLWQALHHARLGYGQALGQIYRDLGWRGWMAQIPVQLHALPRAFADNLLRHDVLRPLAAAIGGVSVLATLWRLRAMKRDAWYLAAYTGVLLLWPFAEEDRRFVWAVLPVLLVQPLLAVVEAAGRRPRRLGIGPLATLWAGALGVLVLPSLAFGRERWQAAPVAQLAEARHFPAWYNIGQQDARNAVERDLALLGALQALTQAVPAGDCVISTRPDFVTYFGHRLAVLPALDSMPEPVFRKALADSGCRYVFGVWATSVSNPEPLYPLARVQSYADALFVSTLPDDAPGKVIMVGGLMKLRPPPWP